MMEEGTAGPFMSAEEQYVSDILNYIDHGDPQVRGATAILCGTLVYSILSRSRLRVGDWLGNIRTLTGNGTVCSGVFSGYSAHVHVSIEIFLAHFSG